jgi:putative toxin-antitoxin system antitoxin component (TIGR02293 family)
MAQTSIKVSHARTRHGYVHLLGMHDTTPARLHGLVQDGLPYSALEQLLVRLGNTGIDLSDVLQIPPRTFHRRKAEGRLPPDESDRLLRFARIFGKVLDLFDQDQESAVAWFAGPVVGLGGLHPLDLVKSEPGCQEIETLVGRLEHGVFS